MCVPAHTTTNVASVDEEEEEEEGAGHQLLLSPASGTKRVSFSSADVVVNCYDSKAPANPSAVLVVRSAWEEEDDDEEEAPLVWLLSMQKEEKTED